MTGPAEENRSGVSGPGAATVEWYAGGRGAERPVAIRIGGERLEVTVEASSVEGDAVAGLPTRRVFDVRDSRGRRYRIHAPVTGLGDLEVELL
ncbi:MAG: hypothetical protein ACM3O7_02685 [Acidobacteriota bacterium]